MRLNYFILFLLLFKFIYPSISISQDSEKIQKMYDSARYNFMLGNYEKSIVNYSSVIDYFKYNLSKYDYTQVTSNLSKILFERGLVYSQIHDYENALNDYNSSFYYNVKRESSFYEFRSETLYNLRQYEKAIEDFEKVKKFSLSSGFTDYANCYIKLNKYEKAIKILNSGESLLDSYSIIKNFYLGKCYFHLEKYEDAKVYWKRALDSSEKYFVLLGLNQYDSLGYCETIADYKNIMKYFPENYILYYEIGYYEYELNNYEKSLEAYNKVINLKPEFAEAYSKRGKLNYDLKKYENAIRDYTKCIEINPKLSEVFYSRANAYFIIKDYNQAKNDYTNAIDINSNYKNAYFNRGLILYLQGYYTESIIDYQKAIEILPDDAGVYNNIGYSLLGLHEFQNAIINFKKCLNLDNKMSNAILGIAISYYLQDDFENAKKYLQEAIKVEQKLSKGIEGIEILEMEGGIFTEENKSVLKKLFELTEK